ncbi:MAG: hypothetical protein H5U40_11845, partial [Polyangiaceae bacterium]|nr:hypothetical protein [Polyangiaceae bacterium]
MKKPLIRPHVSAAALLATLLTGCAAEEAVDSVKAPVIYDQDDRFDVYEVPATDIHRQIAENAVAVMIPDGALIENANATASPVNFTLSDRLLDESEGYPICADEPFVDQPAVGSCSGTLIAEDLYMTAGHCVELCADHFIVFDYYFAAAGTLQTINEEDVYACKRVVVDALTEDGLDFAIIE